MSDLPQPFFSLIVPTYNRVRDGKLRRCLNSIATQTLGNFEAVIVDDGSVEDVEGLLKHYDQRFVYLGIEHSGRIIARNAGMAAARGHWVAWLDDDDALDPMYLATFAYHIRGQPETKLWVCGVVVHGMIIEADQHIVPKYTEIRDSWIPPRNPNGPGHPFFTSGKVGTGMFVFARECLDKTGLMPAWKTIYELADGIHQWTGFLMDPPYYSAAKKWVGNPWGDDHAFFLKLCRFYTAHQIKAALYVQYRR